MPPESVLKDYFNTGDDVNPNCTDTDWLGFTFVADSSYTSTKIRLKLIRGALDVGSPYVSIRNASGSYPVGGDLAYSTLPYTDVSLNPGSWLDLALNISINIIQGNSYTIILRCAEDDPEGWDLLGWRADNDPGASYGVSIVSDDSGASWVLGTYYGQGANLAYMFEIWGYDSPPEKAINPTPANIADDTTLDQATMTWENGGGATSYDVYYGTVSGDLSLLTAGQAGLSFTISGISNGSPFGYEVTRYWRIDSVNEGGTTTGDEWSFTTLVFDPPAASVNSDGDVTGENNMLTVRRVVAAANNKMWVEI